MSDTRYPITEHVAKSDRHTTFYLACGPEQGTPVIFCHGWPELSITWRRQLAVLGALGFRAIAPDMRGYGRSSTYEDIAAYCQREIAADMIELLDSLGAQKAVWVGHDWGTPVVWSIAQHHPDRCLGVAGVCIPYLPAGFVFDELVRLVDRTTYPEEDYPVGQWDYWLYYAESLDEAAAATGENPYRTVKLTFRAGDPAARGAVAPSARMRANGGFKGIGEFDVPIDERVIDEQEARAYAAALERNGFRGPDSWYLNSEANAAYAQEARANWRLGFPVLFVHADYDPVAQSLDLPIAEPMKEYCDNLTEEVIAAGHWVAQEKPQELNAALVRWLAVQLPEIWI
ncbi:MAG: alpha/beta hydrolase [Novosphingobium sp.]|nr:alpha/beta hydrolase [Novosphingobium sp.]